MCGIIGYTGFRPASPIVISSLKRLEYRGYDSAGLAVIDSQLHVYKDVGTIETVIAKVPEIAGTTGIGHTRWATHGEVTKINAHPHTGCGGRIAIVHNGIIENFQAIRDELESSGHKLVSETDSEVIAHLVEQYYEGSLEKAVFRALKEIKGSYAILAVSCEEPDTIVAARKESPLVVGIGDNEHFIASDIPAFLPYTKRAIFIDDNELVVLHSKKFYVKDKNQKVISKDIHVIEWDIESAQKGGYQHFMLKEINEQPVSLSHTLRGRLTEIDPMILINLDIDDIKHITIVACGTSYYAGLVGKHFLEELSSIPVSMAVASEYRYFGPKIGTVIAVTQSGETIDTLGALREAQKHGCDTIAVTNVDGSTVTRIADMTLLTRCGPEIGVAATKTFTSQITLLLLLALQLGLKNGSLHVNKVRDYVSNLRQLPSYVRRVFNIEDSIRVVAKQIKHAEHIFFIGRGIQYPLAMEGALKLKEISYIHAEGFAAGELKHGPFALLTKQTPVIALVGDDRVREKTLTSIGEVKARGSPVYAFAPEHDNEIERFADAVVRLPSTPQLIECFPMAVALQLLAYYVADARGCSIDKPRNLAKSVTVE